MPKPKFLLPSPKDMKNLRLARNYTQTQLATLTGLSQSLIARIENGTVNPRVSTLQLLLSVLYRESDKTEAIDAMEMATQNLIVVNANETISKAIEIMNRNSISQLPVVTAENEFIGSISERKMIIHLAQTGKQGMQEKIINVLEPIFQRIPNKTTINDIEKHLLTNSALLIEKNNRVVGILTKSDLLQFLKKTKTNH